MSDGISSTTVVIRTRVDLVRPSLGLGVPRFARRGGASRLRSARRLPFGFEFSSVLATKIYGFRNDCSRIRSVMIAYASAFLRVACNFCKQAKICVRLALHFPLTYAKNVTRDSHIGLASLRLGVQGLASLGTSQPRNVLRKR